MATHQSFKIPRAILPLIEKPPLLRGESLQDYNELLAGLVHDVMPSDIPEWLWLIQFLDCSWEIWRNRGYRAKLINWQRDQSSYGSPPETALAIALVKAAPKTEVVDKILERLQRRCDTILQQLEIRREVFAHRARHAAENVLNRAKPSLLGFGALSAVPLLPESTNQSTPDQTPTDEKTIVPGDSDQAG